MFHWQLHANTHLFNVLKVTSSEWRIAKKWRGVAATRKDRQEKSVLCVVRRRWTESSVIINFSCHRNRKKEQFHRLAAGKSGGDKLCTCARMCVLLCDREIGREYEKKSIPPAHHLSEMLPERTHTDARHSTSIKSNRSAATQSEPCNIFMPETKTTIGADKQNMI